MVTLELLRENPAFREAAPATLERLARASELVVKLDGEVVIRFGSPLKHVFLVRSGQLELYRKNSETDAEMLVGRLEPPAIFGDAELYAGSAKWIVSARAMGSLQAVQIPVAAFDQAVRQDHALAVQLYRDACARHLLVIHIVQIQTLQRTQHKILRLLWDIGEPDRPGGYRRAPLEQARLARALGMERKTIARNLSDLEAKGLLRREGGSCLITVPDESLPWKRLERHGFGASWRLGTASVRTKTNKSA